MAGESVSKYPHQQPFNIKGTRNKKKNSWYQHAPYHNNNKNRKAESQ